jgi:hypothetical protein
MFHVEHREAKIGIAAEEISSAVFFSDGEKNALSNKNQRTILAVLSDRILVKNEKIAFIFTPFRLKRPFISCAARD